MLSLRGASLSIPCLIMTVSIYFCFPGSSFAAEGTEPTEGSAVGNSPQAQTRTTCETALNVLSKADANFQWSLGETFASYYTKEMRFGWVKRLTYISSFSGSRETSTLLCEECDR